jgi:hypothetical protein
MDELSSVLREVLRALGMEADGRVRAPRSAADGRREPGGRGDPRVVEDRAGG